MKPLPIVSAISLSLATLLPAQLPEEGGGALAVRAAPAGAVGARLETSDRRLTQAGRDPSLEMNRVVATAQFPVAPGVTPWIEAGWHTPELDGVESDGGFTWGAGLSLRPWLWSLRHDPQLGPRDWVALRLEAAVRGGEADNDLGDLEWLSVEGRAGLEWRQRLLGGDPGPVDASALTVGAGLVLGTVSAEQPGFDGSEDQPVGIYVRTGFDIGTRRFLGLEADWYNLSDRRLALVAGVRF